MPRIPEHQAQLGRGIPVPGRTRGALDCGPRSWQGGIAARTGGRLFRTVARLRARGRVPGPVPTNIDDARRACDGLRVPGRRSLRYYRRRRARDVRRAVRAGLPVQLAISYRAWNESQDERTGDPRFMGGHSVLIYGERVIGDQHGVEWLLYDSLDDKRRRGIPQGPRWVKRRDLIAAAVALAGGDRDGIWAGIFGGAR